MSFNFVADAMLQLSDSDRRLSISDNLFRLCPLSKGLGTSTGGILVNGNYTMEKIESRYKSLRTMIWEASEGQSPLEAVLWNRWSLLKSVEKSLRDWQREVRKGWMAAVDVGKARDDMFAESMAYERSTATLAPDSYLRRWAQFVSNEIASISKLLGITFPIADEIDEWWGPFISKPLDEYGTETSYEAKRSKRGDDQGTVEEISSRTRRD